MASVRNLGLFPFCILDPANDINSSFVQMEMSQNLGLAFWWRVKNWRVDSASLTIINTETEEESEVPMPTGEMTVTTIPEGGISSEKQLVCQFSRQFGVGFGPLDTNIFLRIFPSANQSGGLIKMQIDVRAQLQTTRWFLGNGAEPSPFTVGNCTINVLGQQLIFPIGGDFSGEGSLVISASEYWPYDPDDGLGPIYDSTTGAQLRPFP